MLSGSGKKAMLVKWFSAFCRSAVIHDDVHERSGKNRYRVELQNWHQHLPLCCKRHLDRENAFLIVRLFNFVIKCYNPIYN
tara:strand:+ start:209 stop:451 length:243 start_codon:yes stop_codon:yes gene_type:complete